MEKEMEANSYRVTYIRHSGFLVETERSYLLFDYWKGELPPFSYHKKLYVFASHVHPDHYTKDIFKLEPQCETVEYILSSDIRRRSGFWKSAGNVHFMKPYEKKEIDGIRIETLRSTDAGVAFLVRADGHLLYHAGDLHWWHWEGEPEEDNERMRRAYQEEMARLKDELGGSRLDCAFVPLDPRQGEAGSWGLDYFLANVGARHVFPMHCWEDYGLIQAYREKNERKYPACEIAGIRAPGDSWEI